MSSFGETIRAQRLRMRLSQEEVAREAGISVAELDGIEQGRQATTKAVIKKLSRSLILSVGELTFGERSDQGQHQ